MKHRKFARFLGLSAACIVSLCLGAYLSYQAAAVQDEAAIENAADASDSLLSPTATPVQSASLAASDNLAQSADSSLPSQPAPVADRIAALPDSTGSIGTAALPHGEPGAALVLASIDASSQRLDLRSGRGVSDAAPPQAAIPDPVEVPTAALPLETPLPPVPPAGLVFGKSAPLPPVRPSSLTAALPPPGVVVPLPPVAPAPTVATVAQPTPTAAPAVPAPPVPATALVARAAPPAGSTALPGGIADALSAVTASVGGANATLTPHSEAAATPEAVPPAPVPPGSFKAGSPVYVRIFKQEGALELWMKRGDAYALVKTFPVCKWSGNLGPKLRTADLQSPEGFYSVSARQLNPHSHYHLAFDVGYPNAYDRRQGATGSAVMVHGDCKSVGCFAMTNAGIDEIYGYVAAALAGGQKEVPVHIFPFRMTEEAIVRESAPSTKFLAFLETGAPPKRDWSGFWRNLKQGYDMFERDRVPPVAYACGDRYDFGSAGRACSRIAGW